MRVTLQPAFILHSRPYRDTSVMLDVLTPEHGRIGIVAKGARRSRRRGSDAALLQAFTPLLLSFTGRAELKTLTGVETAGVSSRLAGEHLYSALYINELLVRLLHRNDPHPRLFADYGLALEG
ncbi:MAG: DNA repair protein RecO, partial [Halioglobus sp.]